MLHDDTYYMSIALKLAQKAYKKGDTPIGAVLTYHDRIIGKGYNKRNLRKNSLMHAEIIAINQAARFMHDWRLEECILYVTLEPCPMCAGAIVQARIPKVVIAARNPKAGCAGSVLNLLQEKGLNHQCDLTFDILENQRKQLLQSFFSELRQAHK